MQNINIKVNTNLNDLINEIKTVKPVKEFQTAIRKAVYKHSILSEIIKSSDKIAFELYESDVSENETAIDDTKFKGKSTIDDEEKVVIIIEQLLENIENIDLGIGVENYNFYLYNKTYWEEIDEKITKTFLIEIAIKSGIKSSKARKKRFSDVLFNQFILSASLPIDEKNAESIKINLFNGTYRFDKGNRGVLGEPKKEDYFKYQLSFNYDPESKAEKFQIYLDEVLPDKQSQKVLLEYCAYAFTNSLKIEKVLILYGTGANGKSVFFEILTALFGETNISHYSMERLCDENGYYRAKLGSKLLNYASEFGRISDMQMFKKLISCEPVEARLPYKEPMTISNYCKFIFNANKLPEVEHTDAFFRRQIIIPFAVKIDEQKMDFNLSKKIIATELSGIFNLILEGLDRLIMQGNFSTSETINNVLKNYRVESNSVALFLEEENWITSNTKKTRLKDFYEDYKTYCRDSNQRPFARPNFSKRLREMNLTVESGTNHYTYVWVEKKSDTILLDPFSDFAKNILN